jgi:hypothetical protein
MKSFAPHARSNVWNVRHFLIGFVVLGATSCASLTDPVSMHLELHTDAANYAFGDQGELVLSNAASTTATLLDFSTFCIGLLERRDGGAWVLAHEEDQCVADLVGYQLDPGASRVLPFTVDADRFSVAGEYRFRLGIQLYHGREVVSNTFIVTD